MMTPEDEEFDRITREQEEREKARKLSRRHIEENQSIDDAFSDWARPKGLLAESKVREAFYAGWVCGVRRREARERCD